MSLLKLPKNNSKSKSLVKNDYSSKSTINFIGLLNYFLKNVKKILETSYKSFLKEVKAPTDYRLSKYRDHYRMQN